MRYVLALVAVLALISTSQATARRHIEPPSSTAGLSGLTVLIVRHAEEAEIGRGLSPAGRARAVAYARYFRPLRVGGETFRVDALIAAADSRASDRSRLTLEPLSSVSGVPVQQPFSERHVGRLTAWLARGAPNRTILIAWHHGEIPELLSAFGVDPSMVLGRRHWPSNVYDWVVVLRFDRNGAIVAQSHHLIQEPTPLL